MRFSVLLATVVCLPALLASPEVRAQEKVSTTMLHTALYRVHVDSPVEAPATLKSASELHRLLEKWKEAEKLLGVETLRLQSLAGVSGMAQIGRRVPVVSGEQRRGDTVIRNISMEDQGSVAQVMSRVEGERVFMDIEYEATFSEQIDVADDRPAHERRSLVTLNVKSTLIASFGQATLLQHQQRGEGGILVYAVVDTDGAKNTTAARVSGIGQRATTASGSGNANASRSRSDRSRDFAEKFVKRYDTDNDGSLAYKEFANTSAMRSLRTRAFPKLEPGQKVKAELVIKALLSMGVNGSSARSSETESRSSERVSRPTQDEVSRYREYARRFISRYDRNRDGELDANEGKQSPSFQSDWDEDGNGKVTEDELAQAMINSVKRSRENRAPARRTRSESDSSDAETGAKSARDDAAEDATKDDRPQGR